MNLSTLLKTFRTSLTGRLPRLAFWRSRKGQDEGLPPSREVIWFRGKSRPVETDWPGRKPENKVPAFTVVHKNTYKYKSAHDLATLQAAQENTHTNPAKGKTDFMKNWLRKSFLMASILATILNLTTNGAFGQTNTAATNATAGANNNTTGTISWGATAGNITAVGTPYAVTNSMSFNNTSNYLVSSGYGFSIPAGSIINGIKVDINRQASGSNVTDNRVRLVKAGTIQGGGGQDLASGTAWPTAALGVASYGGTTNLWSNTWTVTDINNAGFGVALSVTSGSNGRTATVDYIQVTIYYTPPPTITSFSPTNSCPGSSITISGTNFTGATAVSFNGTAAAFSVTNSTTIAATIPNGATTGTVSVTTPSGTATSGSSLAVNPTNTITLSSGAGTNNQTVCQNVAITDVTFTTTGATGATVTGLPTGVTGSWSNDQVVITGTPSVSGSFPYSVSLTGGCGTVNASGTITVNAAPAITVSPVAPAAACEGNSVSTMTVSATGGGLTISWRKGFSPITIAGAYSVNTTTNAGVTTSVLTITNPAAGDGGLYDVVVSNTCGTQTSSPAVLFNVNPKPDPGTLSLSLSTICAGSTTTASSTVSGGTWTSSNNSIATVAPDGTVTGVAGGTANIIYTVNNGTCSFFTSIPVTVNARPANPSITTSGSTTICVGTAITYTASNLTMTSYIWTFPAGLIDGVDYTVSPTITTTASAITVTWISPGARVMQLNWTNANGCTAATTASSNTRTVNASPTTSNAGTAQTTCVQVGISLAANTPTVGTGAWSIPSGLGSPSTNTGQFSSTSNPAATFTPTQSGTYTLRWTINNSPCTASTSDVIITVNAPAQINAGGQLSVGTSCTPSAITLSGASVGGSATTGTWSIASGSGTLSFTGPTATPATVTFTPTPGYVGNVVLTLTTDDPVGPCSFLTANRTIVINGDVLVNYAFNSGNSYGALVSNAPAGISASIAGTPFSIAGTGFASGSNSFATNPAGSALEGSVTSTTTPMAWTFTLSGSAIKRYKNFKVYYQTERVSASGAPTPTVTTNYSINSGTAASAGTPSVGSNPFTIGSSGIYSEQLFSLPSGANQPSTSLGIILSYLNGGSGTRLVDVDNFQITGEYVPPTQVTPTAAAIQVCEGGSTDIQIPNSELGINYQLKSGNTNIGSPVAGTGNAAPILLPTGVLSATTTFSIEAIDPNRATCTYPMTNTVTVTVNPKPTVVITEPAAVCAPGTVDLSNAAYTAGSTAGISYSYWQNAGASVALNNFTTAGAGTYYIKGTVDATGCFDIKPITVIVNPLPTVNVTNLAYCIGSSANLTQAVASGTTPGLNFVYLENDGVSPVANAASVTAGTYYIKGIIPATGCFVTQAVTITENPSPTVTITDPAQVCSPATVDITAASVVAGSSAGLTYSYWADNALETSIPDPAHIAVSNTYYIKGTNTNGCSDIKAVSVVVNPKPTVVITDPAPSCDDTPVDLTLSAVSFGSTSGLSFTYWKDLAATDAVPNATQVMTGKYYIKGTTAAGCFDIKPVNVLVNPTARLELETAPSSGYAYSINNLGDIIVTRSTDPGACSRTMTLAQFNAQFKTYVGSTEFILIDGTPWDPQIDPTFTFQKGTNYGINVLLLVNENCPLVEVDFTLVVTDQENPVAKAKNISVQLDASGQATIGDASVDNGSSDNCGPINFSLSKTSFDCNNLGANPVILTVTDGSGNSSTATASVTVEDKINPIAKAKNITVQLDASGQASVAAADINDGSTDNCTIQSYSLDMTSFTCANIGANPVILTVTDNSGNSSTANATITVEDKIAPTAVAKNLTIQLDASGNATVTAAQVNNGSSDNCTIATITLDKTSFDCSNIGANSVVLTVTDVNGNSSTANAVVTIEDKIAPTAVAKNLTIQLDASGAASVTAAQVNNGSSDNCAIATITLDKTSFDCSNIGANNVVLTVTDVNGNSSTANAVVTIEDKIAPTAVAKNLTIQLNSAGAATITAAQVNNGSTDNCSIASITLDKTSFDCSNIGANTVTLTVTDGSGNSSTATATVTVEDKIAPTAVAKNLTIQLDASGAASVTAAQVNNGSSDNCAIATITLDKTSFDCSNIGSNNVVLTVTDVNGNSTTANAVVTVEDKIDPIAVAQNVTIQLDAAGHASATAAQVNNGSSDNCSIATISLSKTSFDCSNIGGNTVTLTVTDGSGNTATATATVTVEDKIAPTAVAKNVTIQLNSAGLATLTAAQVNNGSSDNCAIQSLSIDKTNFDCSNVGTPYVVTLTVTDGSGNSSTATANVTVEDKIAPTAVAKNLTIQLDASGNATVTAAQVNNGSTDNCAIATITLDKTSFDCSNIGSNNVVLTVTDVNGNSSTANAVVTVEDKIDPIAVAQNVTIQLNSAGVATVTAAQVNNGSSDNCSIATISLSKTSFDCSNIGGNTVTLTVTDGSGNTATATATVTVQDNIAPTAVAHNVTIQLNNAGVATLTAAQVNNGSSDNCAILSLSIDKTSFDCSNVGTPFIVTLTVTDVNGNSSSTTASITVQDKVAPTALAKNVTIQLDASGNATVTAAQVNNGSSDNCAIATITLDKTSFDCSNIGTNNVVLTVTDVNGNSATANAVVTVEDKIDPIAVAQNVTIQLNSAGVATVTAAQVNNGSSDNCSIATISLSKTSFDCSNIGGNTVTLTVTDGSGNTATATATVTVEDKIAPVITTAAHALDATLECDDAAGLSAAIALAPQASDNCTIAPSIHLLSDDTVNDPNCPSGYTRTRIWNFTDAQSNTSVNFTQLIVVRDTKAPTFTVPPTATVNTGNDCSYDAAPATTGLPTNVHDNCSVNLVPTYTERIIPGVSIGTFQIERTWHLVDNCGNAAPDQIQIITVADNTPPTFSVPPADKSVNANTNCEATNVSLGAFTVTDNCDQTGLHVTNNKPTTYHIGVNIVTWTVTDASGNFSTHDQKVTVVDNTPPTISNMPSDITLFTGNGASNCTMITTWTAPTATDNCTLQSLTSDHQSGEVFQSGLTVVTYTAQDVYGNTTTRSFNVTIVDNTKPVFNNVPSNIVTCSTTPTWTDPSASDNCGIATLTHNAPAIFPVGVTNVTYTATDVNGNQATYTFTVTVNPTPNVVVSSNSPVCAGESISLSGTGVGNYSWTGPNGFSSNQQNPTINLANVNQSGDYTLTVTNQFGCSSSKTLTVTVNPAPVASASANASVICAGGTLLLQSSGGQFYQWTGPNNFSSTAQNPTINSITSAGSGIYTVTVFNAAGCSTQAFVQVTVTPAVNALVANNGPVCEGSVINLSAAGGTSYSWTGPNGFSSQLQFPSIPNATTANAGNYTVLVTNAGGCSASATTSVSVQTTPVVSAASNGPVCAGSSISLSGSSNIAGTAFWTGPNGFSSFSLNPTISNATTSNSGLYTLTVTNGNGCAGTATVLVQVNAAPVAQAASNSPICAGGNLQLQAAGGATYSWSGPNGFSSLSQTPVINNVSTSANGIYTVTVTSASGCVTSTSVSVTVNAAPIATASNNGPVCVGGNIGLSASGGTSYSWTGPNGFSSNLQNPVINGIGLNDAGTYTVTVSNTSGCSTTAQTTVQVNALPVASAGSNGTVCTGSTATLTASGGVTYSWSGPNGFSSALQNPVINNAQPAASGTYTVVVTNANGCQSSATADVNVLAAPVATASSNSPVCAGGSITLSVDGGSSWSWTGPNGFSSNLQNPSVANATSVNGGVYNVTVTYASGCVAATSINVVVNTPAVASASNNGPVCEGGNVSLNASNGASWSWSGPNGFTSTARNPVISGATLAAGGTYTVIVTSATGCTSTATTNVVVNALPIASASSSGTVCTGSTVTLQASGGQSYSWSGPNGFTSAQQSPSINNVQPTAAGTYTVTVTNANGCTASASTNVTVTPAVTIGNLTGSATVTSGANAGSLTLNGTTGTVTQWESSFSGQNNWTVINNNTASQSYTNLIANTDYRVLVGGCGGGYSNTQTITVIVPLPPAQGGTLSGSTSICSGGSATLALAGNVGSITQWEYSTNNGANWTVDLSNNTASRTFSSITQTTIYRVLVTSGASTAYSTAATITVNPAVTIGTLTGAATVISGSNSGTLTLTGSTGTVSQWESSPTGLNTWTVLNNTTTSQAYLNLTASTDYRALVGGCGGGYSNVQTITVNANTPPAQGGTLSGSTSICSGGSATLSLAGNVGSITQWEYSTNGGTNWTIDQSNNTSSRTFTGITQTTLYRVLVTSGASTAYSTAATVTVNTAGTATASALSTSVCTGSSINLQATGGTSFNWTGPNGFTSTAQNPVINGATTLASGTYTVIVTGNACGGGSSAYNVFGTTVPNVANSNDGQALTVGMKFRSSAAGQATGVRFYKATGNTGTHVGYLYSSTGTVLSSVVFNSETASGWQSASFGSPVTLAANTTYVVALFSSAGNYSGTSNYFTTAKTNGPLTGLANGTDGANGVYRYGNTAALPNSSFQSSNYWVDVAFNAGASASVNVTVNPAVTIGTLTGATTVITGSNSGALTLTGSTGTVTRWESSPAGQNNWSNISNTNTSQSYQNLTASTDYRVLVGGCSGGYSNIQSITVNANVPPAQGGTLAADLNNICSGTSVNLTLSGNVGTITAWQQSSDGGTTWTTFSNNAANPTPVTPTVTTMYRAQVTSGIQTALSTTVTVTVNASITAGTLSTIGSSSVCSGNNNGTLQITQPVNNAGTIARWEFKNGNANSTNNWQTINATTLTITYNNLTQTRTYRVAFNSCSGLVYSNMVTITTTSTPIAGTAAGAVTTCSGINSGTVTLSGFTGNVVRWQWSATGNGGWNNIASSASATYSWSNLTQNRFFRAQVTGCGTTNSINSSAVLITVNPPSVGGTLSGSTTVCGVANAGILTLSGQTGSVIRWEYAIGNSNTWNTVANTTSSLSYTNLTQTTRFRAVVASGECAAATSSEATVTVTPAPVISALTGSTTWCLTTNTGSLSLTVSGAGSSIIRWEFSTNGGATWSTLRQNGRVVTASSYTYTNLAITTSYRVLVGGCANVYSSVATVTIGCAAVAPTASGLVNSNNPKNITLNQPAEAFLNGTVFPNPTTSYFSLKIEASANDKVEILISDMAGRPVTRLVGAPGTTLTFGNNWTSGMYVVDMRQGQLRKVIKVIKL